MNSTAFNNGYPNSPFSKANNNTFSDKNNASSNKQEKGLLSGLSGMFSSGGKNDTLPFAYADAAHQQTTAANPSTSSSSWLPTFLTSNGTPSLATSTTLSPTQQWIETFGLTRVQRYTAFAICIVAAVFLFFLAMFHLPFVVIRPAKFVVPYCMGSMFILVSFGFLHGFVSYSKHLLSPKKVVYSAWFSLATLGTLYAALSLKSYILTVVMALIQMAGMLTFIISYVPGGSSGISFMSTMIGSSIKSRFSPNSF
jgi:hypothetical protein